MCCQFKTVSLIQVWGFFLSIGYGYFTDMLPTYSLLGPAQEAFSEVVKQTAMKGIHTIPGAIASTGLNTNLQVRTLNVKETILDNAILQMLKIYGTSIQNWCDIVFRLYPYSRSGCQEIFLQKRE